MDCLSPPSLRNRNHHLAFFFFLLKTLRLTLTTFILSFNRRSSLGEGSGPRVGGRGWGYYLGADRDHGRWRFTALPFMWSGSLVGSNYQPNDPNWALWWSGWSEYSCTVLRCLCAQHWPICCKTAWSCWGHWVCVEAFSVNRLTVAPCKCCLCAWSFHNRNYCWDGSFCTLVCFILGADFEGATKKKKASCCHNWKQPYGSNPGICVCDLLPSHPPVWSWCNRQACHPQIRGNNAAFPGLPLNMSLWEQHNQPRVTTSCSVQAALE